MLGLYYLSILRDKEPGEGMLIGSIAELEHALAAGVVTLHAKIKARFTEIDAEGKDVTNVHETTPGRYILGQHLPQ